MKFYEMELEAQRFMKGAHTLTEWADFGFNKVIYDDKEYWDGLLDGMNPIEDDGTLLVWSERDWDEDGFMYLVLETEQAHNEYVEAIRERAEKYRQEVPADYRKREARR